MLLEVWRNVTDLNQPFIESSNDARRVTVTCGLLQFITTTFYTCHSLHCYPCKFLGLPLYLAYFTVCSSAVLARYVIRLCGVSFFADRIALNRLSYTTTVRTIWFFLVCLDGVSAWFNCSVSTKRTVPPRVEPSIQGPCRHFVLAAAAIATI